MKFLKLIGLLIVFTLAGFAVKNAFAVNSGQVTICHATASNSNPYVQESPNIQNDGSLDGGHLNHTGPIFPASNWGDIIPPYTFYTCPNGYQLGGTQCTKNNKPNIPATQVNYLGMNWNAQGQSIWNKGCNYPTATPTPSPTVTPSPTPSPSPTPTPTVKPSPTPTAKPCDEQHYKDDEDDNCQKSSPTPTPSPTPTVTPTPSGSPSPTPTSTPQSNGESNNGGSNGGGSTFVCTVGKPGSTILISVVKNGANSVVLSWNAVPGATDYIIEYGNTSNNYTYGVPSTGNKTTFTVGSLDLSKPYFFRVIAVNGCAQGDPSNEVQTAFGGPVVGLSDTSSQDNSIIYLLSSIAFILTGLGLFSKNLIGKNA